MQRMRAAHVACLALLAVRIWVLALGHYSNVSHYAGLWCVYAGLVVGIQMGNAKCLRYGYLPALVLLVLDGPNFLAGSWATYDGVLTRRDPPAALTTVSIDAVLSIVPACLVLWNYVSRPIDVAEETAVSRWAAGLPCGCLVGVFAFACLLCWRESFTETSADGRLTVRATTSSALSQLLFVGHIHVEVFDNRTVKRVFVDDIRNGSGIINGDSDNYVEALDVLWHPNGRQLAVVVESGELGYVSPQTYSVRTHPVLSTSEEELTFDDWGWVKPELVKRSTGQDPHKRTRALKLIE